MALFDEDVFNQLTSAGIYRMFARPTLDVLRRRYRTGDVDEDVTPGYMPGGDENFFMKFVQRGEPGAIFQGQPVFSESDDVKGLRQRLTAKGGGYALRPLNESGAALRGGQLELLGQEQGLIKALQSQQAVRGISQSPIGAAAYGLGMDVFHEQASLALAPLLARQRQAEMGAAQFEGALDRRRRYEAEQLAWMRQPKKTMTPGKGSLFFETNAIRRGRSTMSLQPRVQPPRT